MTHTHLLFALAFVLLAGCSEPDVRFPIIDMHYHAPLSHQGSGQKERDAALASMQANNVVLSIVSITSPEQLDIWIGDGTPQFIAGPMMPCPQNLADPQFYCFPRSDGLPDMDWLEDNVQSGRIGVFHELMFNYDGTPPGAEKMDRYWALAAEYDIPVGVHTWSGPPPGQSIRRDPNCCPDYNGNIGNPKNLRPVLEKYPTLKIWMQHIGSDGDPSEDLWSETLALLSDYPSVYVDLSITNSVLPVEGYETALKRLIDAGFGDRILFGSDNLPVELILGRLTEISAISEEQRRDILYNNAAAFLGLSEKTRRIHHRH